ncbi:MAG: MFS transporter [Bacteroidaceae bacterium]|nr:MFS transporter [Bacteroidaceae bacterium]
MKNLKLIPVMLCFFAMGFVDLVGIASNYVQKDLSLSDSVANTLPSLVFFWFLLFSIPTGLLMNKIGRKNTVLLSLLVTIFSLSLPLLGETFPIMLAAFSLLGIGNALMQTSLNPLISTLMKGGNVASTLTLGQFIKAIASFLAPYLAMWGATAVIPSLGYGWRALFWIYLVVGIIATLLLFLTPIEEEKAEANSQSVGKQFYAALALLGHPTVLLAFLGIICCVGIDVGTNTTAPKLLMERIGLTIEEAGFATSLYFIARTIGCLTGAFFLRVMSTRRFFLLSVLLMVVAMIGMAVGDDVQVLYASIAMVGFGNSNIFPIIFAKALQAEPKQQNEVSALMIMGLFGGTIFPLLMGISSDLFDQLGAVLVMTVGVLYLLAFVPQLKRKPVCSK